MRTRDERPANGGGHPDDPRGAVGPMRGPDAVQNAGTQKAGTQHMSAPYAGAQGTGTQDTGTQGMGTQNMGTQGMDPRSAGTQRPAGPPPASYDPYADDEAYSADDPAALLREPEDEFHAETSGPVASARWTAGADLGLLVLRLGLGALFVLHGSQKLFGAFGGPGQGGFAAALNAMGFQQAAILSPVTGVTEVLAGVLLVFGLGTPLAAAGVLGVMIPAIVTGLDNGFFAPDGVELAVVMGVLALGVLFAGPGRAALDNGRAWSRRPLLFGTLGLVVAIAASSAVLVLLHQSG